MAAEPSPLRSRPPLVWPRGIRRRDSPSARSIANQMALSHLGKTRLAELVINKREECRHDRTPLFDQRGKLDWQLFQGSFAARQNGFFSAENLCRSEHVKEISSRVRGDPLQAGWTLRREDALVYRAGLLN